MRRSLAFLALAGFAALPIALGAQDLPDALKDKALVVKVTAIVTAAVEAPGEATSSGLGGDAEKPAWSSESIKNTVPGMPVPFKLVGSNVAILVQITPFESEDGKGVTLIAQGQVWVKPPQGGLSYHTSIDTLSIAYGETVLFFPLGIGPDGKATMRLEISVVRASNNNPDVGGVLDKAGK